MRGLPKLRDCTYTTSLRLIRRLSGGGEQRRDQRQRGSTNSGGTKQDRGSQGRNRSGQSSGQDKKGNGSRDRRSINVQLMDCLKHISSAYTAIKPGRTTTTTRQIHAADPSHRGTIPRAQLSHARNAIAIEIEIDFSFGAVLTDSNPQPPIIFTAL